MREIGIKRDVLADDSTQHRDGLLHDLVQRERSALNDLFSAVSEQLSRLMQSRAFRRALHPVGRGIEPFSSRCGLRNCRRGIAEDDGQDVVEIVRDACGKAPYGLHLLRLAQFGFPTVLWQSRPARSGADTEHCQA